MLNSIGNYVQKIREELHRYPETDFTEFKTKEIIERELQALEIEYCTLAKTGTVAVIEGKSAGKTVLLRADIDGLPILEKTDVPFKSLREGYMHACGHDVHTACLLGAAKILKKMRGEIEGCVKLVFQPAEEGVGGAKPMIDAGVLKNPDVDAAFAMHVEPLEQVGNIQLRDGAIMASPDEFTLKITGVGGHGSMPHRCVDPIAAAAAVINEFQKVVRTSLSPFEPCVVSVCSIHSGTCPNVIPQEATIEGTVRSFDESVRRKIAHILERTANEVSLSMGAKCEFEFRFLYPPLINNGSMNMIVANAARKINSIKEIIYLDNPSMAGDDFSYFAQNVPASYFKLGVGNDKINYPIHSPYFDIDNKALQIGAELMAEIAADYLNTAN